MDSTLPPVNPSSGPPPLYPLRPAAPPPKRYGWKIAALVLGCLLVLSLFFHLRSALSSLAPVTGGRARYGGPRLQEAIVEDHDSPNKIAVLSVEGIISGGGFDGGGFSLVEYIKQQLRVAAEDSRVEAVVLKVNSPGGEVLASDDIAQAIEKFQTETGKPVIASMGSLAASGGYYVSAPCRWIVANELTITGSIGVIMHSFNYRGLMKKVGLTPLVIKSGRFKDMLSGTKDLEEMSPQERDDLAEERRMLQNLIDETYEQFKSVVAEGRQEANRRNKSNPGASGQPLTPKWTNYADGRVLSGKEAHTLGLVDELGNLETAVERAKKLAHIKSANLIEYQPVFDLSHFFRLFGKSDTTRIQLDVGLDTPKLRAGQPYFLSPTFVH